MSSIKKSKSWNSVTCTQRKTSSQKPMFVCNHHMNHHSINQNHEIVSHVPLFNSFHPCLSISNSKKSETGRERNNRRAGNSHQVFNSSYSMFMTLSFASSPFSPRMDFLFASARTSSLLGTIMAPRRRWSYSENSGRKFVTSVALI